MTENRPIVDMLLNGLDIKQETSIKAKQMHPLVLAFIGDTIFDLAVRTMLVKNFDTKVHSLHKMSSSRARASAQAKAARVIISDLDKEETDVFFRARNAKSATVPKNASLEDYSLASALEAVIGYLYLTGNDERLLLLLKKALAAQDDDSTKITRVFRP